MRTYIGARLVEQRRAEAQRLDLHHVVARLGERNADHLERPRVAACELRQIEPLGVGVAAEQRDLARADPALDLALDRPALGVQRVLDGEPFALRQPGSSAVSWVSWYFGSLRIPGQDVGVAVHALHPHLAGAGRGRRAGRGAPPRSSPCTWRNVTGSIASAFRSIMPNGAAANLAIGGVAPVATLSGKLAGVGERPAGVVLSSRGSSTLNAAFSASGWGR